jgi:zinc-binding oxidoreductase
MKSVKAVQFYKFGDVDVLECADISPEVLLDNQVRVRTYAVGLNPVDYKIFKGVRQLRALSFLMKLKHPSKWFKGSRDLFPRGVARDFSGVITEVGKNVTQFSIGDRVFGTIVSAPGLGSRKGALATELCVQETEITLKPENIDFPHAATLGVSALTVGGAFRKLDIKKDDVIVISGASGGIGSIAVQYAISMGAKVMGIASEKSAGYLERLGAVPISYNGDIKEKIVNSSNDKVTKFLDCFGGKYVKLGFELGLSGSQIATLIPTPYAMLRGAQFTGPRHSKYEDFLKISELVSDGKIQIHLDKEYDFSIEAIREAYRDLETGHTRGKRVIKMPNSEVSENE